MIYILSGNDNKNKKNFLKKLYKENSIPVFDYKNEFTKENLLAQAGSVSLFGDESIVVLDNALSNKNIILSTDDLDVLKNSKTVFVFLEDKLLVADLKKYKKYAEIEDFKLTSERKIEKMNIFSITDAFARKDKIETWILYREAVSFGIPSEEISGVLFWKIKSLILNNNKLFSQTELKNISSRLTSIYHDSHSGKCDFSVALEELILSSLNKK